MKKTIKTLVFGTTLIEVILTLLIFAAIIFTLIMDSSC